MLRTRASRERSWRTLYPRRRQPPSWPVSARLAAVVERRGGAIYENTDVTEVRSGSDARFITAAGELRAKRAILLAGEAYLTSLRQYHRSLLPMYSLISLTEPLKPKSGAFAALNMQ